MRPWRNLKCAVVRERRIVDAVRARVHATGGDFVQQRLPDMRGERIDERDSHARVATIAIAERRRERQPAGATADDDDFVSGAVPSANPHPDSRSACAILAIVFACVFSVKSTSATPSASASSTSDAGSAGGNVSCAST